MINFYSLSNASFSNRWSIIRDLRRTLSCGRNFNFWNCNWVYEFIYAFFELLKIILGICSVLSGLSSGGYSVCFNDVAGIYGSLAYGISNSIGESTGVIVPYIVSELTKNVSFFIK